MKSQHTLNIHDDVHRPPHTLIQKYPLLNKTTLRTLNKTTFLNNVPRFVPIYKSLQNHYVDAHAYALLHMFVCVVSAHSIGTQKHFDQPPPRVKDHITRFVTSKLQLHTFTKQSCAYAAQCRNRSATTQRQAQTL